MKQKIFTVVMMAVMMTASVNLASCSKDDGGGSSSASGTGSALVGTWQSEYYYEGDRDNLYYPTGEDYDLPMTTVTLRADGSCSGEGLLINGSGSWTVKTGDKWNDGYWAIVTFSQNGKTVGTATVKTYTNDRKTGFVEIAGQAGKTFVFERQ